MTIALIPNYNTSDVVPKIINDLINAVNAGPKSVSLPTADPGVAGMLWNSSGVLKVSAGPVAFDAGGVNFDGATWLVNNALTASNSTTVSFSMWVRTQTGFPYGQIWSVDPENTYTSNVYFHGTNQLFVGLEGVDYTEIFNVQSDALSNAAWHHILFSGDTNHAAGLKIGKMYVDGVSAGTILNDADAAFTMLYNGLPLWIGADGTDGDQYQGNLAEFWFAPGQSLLTAGDISPATLAKFYNAGAPVDLGADGSTPTGTAPAIYFHKTVAAAASTFATNHGTGGSFVTTGTLTNSGTNP